MGITNVSHNVEGNKFQEDLFSKLFIYEEQEDISKFYHDFNIIKNLVEGIEKLDGLYDDQYHAIVEVVKNPRFLYHFLKVEMIKRGFTFLTNDSMMKIDVNTIFIGVARVKKGTKEKVEHIKVKTYIPRDDGSVKWSDLFNKKVLELKKDIAKFCIHNDLFFDDRLINFYINNISYSGITDDILFAEWETYKEKI